jgi:DNA replication protein DnaC
VFTSNKPPSQWKENFKEADALLCSLDRIFDDAQVFNIRSESFRGKRPENIALQARTPYAPMSTRVVAF